MKKQVIAFLLSAVSAAAILSACGSNENTAQGGASGAADGSAKPSYTFKLGHEVQAAHIKNQVAEKFKEELNKRSAGRMQVDIFPAAQLGKEKEMVQQVETGTLDFAIISNGYMSSRSESLNGWFLPFLFPDLKSAAEARKGEAAQQMLKELDSQGIVGMDYFFAGNRHILLRSGLVTTPDDLNGKKIRIPSSPLFEEFWKGVGAGPTPIPLPEVYTSLQTGVIDGVDIDLDALLSQKFYEIAKDLTLTSHMTFPEVVMASKSSFEKLSPEDQQIVREAMTAAVDWGIEEAIKLESSRIEEIKKNGVNVAVFANKAMLQPLIDQMYKEYSEKNPLIKAFLEQNKSWE
ncbi:TRAP transporter substrate-binding protein [Brevibacillus fulvus]|uniref:Tripartite ATP-independent transporter DctP family solute receptor n=1 Tax=Brevibacillus fulvus TaxID=1125967 RepID=A0A938XZW8_9BACL|nr:TRAP transporter substrate-binding protein [Brevibacillus fulvus]MBM7589934.1 tripartite ATP-independent transporter DctP family solute receptor [Brevibacillus fulvus]